MLALFSSAVRWLRILGVRALKHEFFTVARDTWSICIMDAVAFSAAAKLAIGRMMDVPWMPALTEFTPETLPFSTHAMKLAFHCADDCISTMVANIVRLPQRRVAFHQRVCAIAVKMKASQISDSCGEVFVRDLPGRRGGFPRILLKYQVAARRADVSLFFTQHPRTIVAVVTAKGMAHSFREFLVINPLFECADHPRCHPTRIKDSLVEIIQPLFKLFWGHALHCSPARARTQGPVSLVLRQAPTTN